MSNIKLGILFAFCQLIFPFCPAQVAILEIGEIQGDGLVSPYVNQRVATQNNIVTAITADGFYIQSPGVRHDNDPMTSDAIKVFTGTRPSLDTNNVVNVTGQISEINNLTQFRGANLEIEITSGFLPLPEAVKLEAGFPSPGAVALPDLERVEGMLIQFEAQTTGPRIGESEIPMTVEVQRPFREPGIRFPGIDGLPVWDGNPEIFWLTVPIAEVTATNFLGAGSAVECSRAVLTQSGDRYLALPQGELSIRESGAPLPPRMKEEDEWTIGSLNLLMLSREDPFFEIKLTKLSLYIRDQMLLPDILAVQEARDQLALVALANRIQELQPEMEYRVFFAGSNGDFNIAFLVQEDIRVLSVDQLGRELQLEDRPLFDRPPLLITLQLSSVASTRIQILNLHLRSLIDIEDPSRAAFVREKRFRQSRAVANLVQGLQDENLLVMGDFNAFEFSDGYVDVMGQISGTTSLGALLPPEKIVDPPLVNHTAQLPETERYSFVFQGNAELIDHCLSNRFRGLEVRSVSMVRGNADYASDWAGIAESPLRAADHDGLLAYIGPEGTSARHSRKYSGTLDLSFPQPFHNGAQLALSGIKTAPIRVDIVDQGGRTLRTLRVDAGPPSTSIPLHMDIPTGHYWIRVTGSTGQVIRPFIFVNG